MSEPASVSTGIAQRYAAAVFEIAREADSVPALESDIDTLTQAVADSEDFRALIHSPVYTREEQTGAIKALADKMGLTETLTSTLSLMATKRRLFVLPQLLSSLRETIAADKGEMTAEVTSAKALSEAQTDTLVKSLNASTGKQVSIQQTVDESLIGGMIVKLGSRMIDTSIRSRLNSLQNAMKEVG